MHEMSLAVTLVRCLEAEAEKAQLLKVTDVEVEIGSLQAIEPDLFAEAFKAAALGTKSENAKLRLIKLKAWAHCSICGVDYEPLWSDFQCPGCGQAEPIISQGRDMTLLALSGER